MEAATIQSSSGEIEATIGDGAALGGPLGVVPDDGDPGPQEPSDDPQAPAAPVAELPPLEELRVDGTTQLGMIDFGGKKPTSASLVLTGGSVDLVDGRAFEKGDVITGTFTAQVWDVGGVDKHDSKTGIVVSAKQRHKARITDLQVKGA